MGEFKIRYQDLSLSKEGKQDYISKLEAVFDHGLFINGPEVKELQELCAKRVGRKYALGVSSGSDALFIALKAMGIGPGDEVITTCLSWIATTNAIARTGATPVFCAINDDLNISADSVEKMISEKTKCILVVHFSGRVCEMDRLKKISVQHRVPIIEDAAQAFGAEYKGDVACSFGEMACLSLNPMKVFASYGEAGMIFLDNQEQYEKMKVFALNGMIDRIDCVESGINSRLDTVQAAFLLQKLETLDEDIQLRRIMAEQYDSLLPDSIKINREDENHRDIYYTYVISIEQRDGVFDELLKRGIEVQIQHKKLMSDHPIYQNCPSDDLNRSREVSSKTLCLPMHKKLTEENIRFVAENVTDLL